MKYTAAELDEAFRVLLARFDRLMRRHNVPYMLIGGLAVGAWTEPRGTKDCDFALKLPRNVEPLAEALADDGFAVDQRQLELVKEGGHIRLAHNKQEHPPMIVDLLCVGSPFEEEALDRAHTIALFDTSLSIATPDDLVVYKLIAGRPQDFADIDRLIRFGAAPQDLQRLRKWAVHWEVEGALERALKTAAR